SLLVARLITPMMAAYLMRAKDADEKHAEEGALMRGYLWLIRHTTAVPRLPWIRVRFPAYYLTFVVAVLVVIVSVIFMMKVPGNLFPPDDESRFAISVELPPGSTLDETARTTEVMRRTIESVEGVERILVIGGASPLGDIDIRRANVVVILERLDNGLKRKLLELAGKLPVIGSS